MAKGDTKVLLIFLLTIATVSSAKITVPLKPHLHHNDGPKTFDVNEVNEDSVSDLGVDHENPERRNIDEVENEVKSATSDKVNKVEMDFPPIFWDRMGGEDEQLNNEEYKSRLTSALENVKSETADLEKAVQEGKVDMDKVLEIGDLHNIVSLAEIKHN